MTTPRGEISQSDMVRAAVRTLRGEFSPSAIAPLVPEINRQSVRSVLAALAGQRELRLVRQGNHAQEAVYEALPELHRTPSDAAALRFAGAFLQALYLAWGARRPSDNLGVLRASAE